MADGICNVRNTPNFTRFNDIVEFERLDIMAYTRVGEDELYRRNSQLTKVTKVFHGNN